MITQNTDYIEPLEPLNLKEDLGDQLEEMHDAINQLILAVNRLNTEVKEIQKER